MDVLQHRRSPGASQRGPGSTQGLGVPGDVSRAPGGWTEARPRCLVRLGRVWSADVHSKRLFPHWHLGKSLRKTGGPGARAKPQAAAPSYHGCRSPVAANARVGQPAGHRVAEPPVSFRGVARCRLHPQAQRPHTPHTVWSPSLSGHLGALPLSPKAEERVCSKAAGRHLRVIKGLVKGCACAQARRDTSAFVSGNNPRPWACAGVTSSLPFPVRRGHL